MAKRPERNFLKPTQISKHLNCTICSEVFNEPMRLYCGHTFCHKCIKEWAAKNKTCPLCRKDLDIGLMGKDLIAEKIIMDLEVLCSNRLCDWKDRLENLPKHLKGCAYNKTPDWLKAQSAVKIDDNPSGGDTEIPFLVSHDEQFIERVNEEVSRKSLLERLYTKDEETMKLVDSVFNTDNTDGNKSKGKGKGKGRGKGKGKATKAKGKKGKESITKEKSFEDYENFLCTLGDSDEETKEDQDNQVNSDQSSKKESITSKQGEGSHAMINEENSNAATTIISQKVSQNQPLNEANQDLLGEDTPEEPTIGIVTRRSGRNKGKPQKQNFSSEPNLVKKVKTVTQ